MEVAQAGDQLTITGSITLGGQTIQIPAVTGTLNATGFFTIAAGSTVGRYGSGPDVRDDARHPLDADLLWTNGPLCGRTDDHALRAGAALRHAHQGLNQIL